MTTTHLVLRYIHIIGGTLALSTGLAAMLLPKGSQLHRRAGNVFFVSMLMLSVAGVALASLYSRNAGNIMGGFVAFYMVSTAWVTVLRPAGRVGRGEVALAAVGGLGTAAALAFGIIATIQGSFAGYLPILYYVFAAVAMLSTAGDVRMILRGGVTGLARTTRHLWRMSVAFFMATGSFFFGQPKFVPLWMKETKLFVVAGLLPLALMLFWLVWVRLPRRERRSLARHGDAAAVGAGGGGPRGASV